MINNEGKNSAVVNNVVKKLKDRAEKTKKIISNKNYINWLKEFSKTRPNFDSQTLPYDDELSQDEQNKASAISLLIDAIDDYCEKTKEARPIKNKETIFPNFHFNVQDGDFRFTIGRVFGQGCLEYFHLGFNQDEDVIDFDDLVDFSQNYEDGFKIS